MNADPIRLEAAVERVRAQAQFIADLGDLGLSFVADGRAYRLVRLQRLVAQATLTLMMLTEEFQRLL